MRFTLSTQPQQRAKITGDSLAELRAHLADVERVDSIQFSLDKTDADGYEEGLLAYFNAHRAWVIWMNQDSDWLYPINANWRDLEDATEGCYLENGQLDTHEIRWSQPKTEAIRLLTHYFEHGELAPWIEWTDEYYWYP